MHPFAGANPDLDLVPAGKADESEQSGEDLGVLKFVRLTEIHRSAGVDEDGDRQLLVDLILPDVALAEPGIEVRIQVAEIIAGLVLAVIGEFHPCALGS